MCIVKIISGGRTVVDRAGLDAAMKCGIPHGGWCLKGRRSISGIIKRKYKLTELNTTDSAKLLEANVVDSDATIIFTVGKLSKESKENAEFCKKHNKPYLHIDLCAEPLLKTSNPDAPKPFIDPALQWLGSDDMPDKVVLNVAGSEQSKGTMIYNIVWIVMQEVIKYQSIDDFLN